MQRVVLVDDDENLLNDVARLLNRSGYEVVASAVTWPEGVEAVRQFQPDVVLLDIHIPPGSGLDAVAAMRVDCHSACIVAFSADESKAAADECERAGANGFISKLLPPAQMLERLRNSCGSATGS